jgi:hypothetical protein
MRPSVFNRATRSGSADQIGFTEASNHLSQLLICMRPPKEACVLIAELMRVKVEQSIQKESFEISH